MPGKPQLPRTPYLVKSACNARVACANSSYFRSKRATGMQQQRGDVLLFVLFALLVTLLGAMYAMRGLINDTVVAGNAMQRQKNVQMGDAALAQATKVITDTLGGTDGSVALQIAANGSSWFYIPAGVGAWAAPAAHSTENEGFWSLCVLTGAAVPCPDIATLPGMSALPGGYTARMVVVPTNLPADPQACATTGYVASYYNIFLNVREPNGITSANVESVFKQCVLDL